MTDFDDLVAESETLAAQHTNGHITNGHITNGHGELHPLRAALEACGGSMKSLNVLSSQVDPFRLDTPANHRDGQWIAQMMNKLGIGRIHARGLHYSVLTHPKPDGTRYTTTDDDWEWLLAALKAARWLGDIDFDRITDKKHDAPVTRLWHPPPQPTPYVWVDSRFEVTVPDADDLEPYIGVDDFDGTQPYHLAIFGEKSSLEPVLGRLAERYQADLYLATGNVSDTMVHTLAKTSAADGRSLIVAYFSDSDPSGHNMLIEVARKLQAFKVLHYPDLEFECYRVALRPDQVRRYDLPGSPLKESERRADKWMAATGTAQTEIDSIATLRPDLLRQIAEEFIGHFYDRTLYERVERARQEWREHAQAAFDEQADDQLEQLRADAAAQLAEKRDQIRAEVQSILDTVRVDAREFDLPELPEVPQAELDADAQPTPLCDSRWSFAEQCRRLIASKRYEVEETVE